MALDLGTGAASKQALVETLAALMKRYAGDAAAAAPPGPKVMSDEELAAWLQANPSHQSPPGSMLGGNWQIPAWQQPAGFLPAGAPAASAPGASGGGALGPYNTAGDGGAWAANGVNLYNPNLARGDMPAPGPIGKGPGFWELDNFGTPFFRADWENRPGQGWVIKGSSW